MCADQRNPFQLDFVNFDYLSLSAGVRWGLDYGVRVARARQARAEWRKAAAVQRGAEANAGQEVSAAWHRYAEARARVAVIQKGLDAAEAWHRGSSRAFLAGKGRASDYAESLSIVLRFRQDALRAVHQVSFAASTLELAAGVEL